MMGEGRETKEKIKNEDEKKSWVVENFFYHPFLFFDIFSVFLLHLTSDALSLSSSFA